MVDGAGGPLSVVVAGANVHDTKLLKPTLESIVVDRPEGTQNLCLDQGYDNPTGHRTVAEAGYQPHIRRIGEEKLDQSGEKTHPARRWVVERTLAWLSKCRAILVRYDKKASNYLRLLQLACALIWYRRQWSLDKLRSLLKFLVLLASAVLVAGATAVLIGCGPPAPAELERSAPPASAAARETAATVPPAAQTEPANTVTPVQEATDTATNAVPKPTPTATAATVSQDTRSGAFYAVFPTATSTLVPENGNGLEFVSSDSRTSLGRDGGITSGEQRRSDKDRSSSGPVEGQAYTWEDGDRTLTVYLQDDLVVEKDSAGMPRNVVEADRAGTSLARGAREKPESDTLPVFRTESGSLMTLPGGVLLVLNEEWSQAQTNAFLSSNGIKKDRVSELSYASNGFFITTEPGFPSLQLANRLAALDGVVLSSPNWGREEVPK